MLKDLGQRGNKMRDNLKKFVNGRGFNRVTVGVSGGIDSAVVLCIAQAAFGPDNVDAFTMPSATTSKETLADAHKLCKNLSVGLVEHSISKLIGEYRSTFSQTGGMFGIAVENIQARIRGNILMSYANQENALVLATGNKTEALMGYCTLYGDTVGAVEVIGNLYKCQVYELANEINSCYPVDVIPQSIITRPPSAELSEGQTDEEDMGITYEKLDKILMRIEDNAFKLEQCPPALKID
jgi:NAD+ synthetase